MRSTTTWVLAAALVAVSGTAAGEESEKVRKARSENELEKSAESADASCGTKLVARIDWASFDADRAWDDKSVASYCGAPLDELRRLCEGPATRAYVARTVKSLTCQAVKTKAEWAVLVKDGALTWKVPPDAVNAGDFAHRAFLERL